MDPSLFAFTFIVEELKKAPETIRIVNVGSTDIKNQQLSTDQSEAKNELIAYFEKYKNENKYAHAHQESPVRQKFRDRMLELIFDRENNKELYFFNHGNTIEKENELYDANDKKPHINDLVNQLKKNS